MKKLKTLADLKRVPVGTVFRKIRDPGGPTDKIRIVAEQQSGAIKFDGPDVGYKYSFLRFPKAREFIGTDAGFQIVVDGKILVEYILDKEVGE